MVFIFTERFKDALLYSTQLHASQFRKGSQTPYIAHLLSVTALVLEAGGDEDLAIAALLHDAVEDQGGLETLALMRIHSQNLLGKSEKKTIYTNYSLAHRRSV
jgi:(p)ppGpp synthase/HD superfamily hydrolase